VQYREKAFQVSSLKLQVPKDLQPETCNVKPGTWFSGFALGRMAAFSYLSDKAVAK